MQQGCIVYVRILTKLVQIIDFWDSTSLYIKKNIFTEMQLLVYDDLNNIN